MDAAALTAALTRAASDAGWALEVATQGQDERGPLLVVGLRPNPSPYGALSSVAQAKARVATMTAAFMDQHSRGLAYVEEARRREALEGEVDPD